MWLDGADEGRKGTEGHLLLLLDGLDPLDEDLLLPVLVLIVAGCLLLGQHPQLLWAAAASPGRGALVLQRRSSRFGGPSRRVGLVLVGGERVVCTASGVVSSAVAGWLGLVRLLQEPLLTKWP